MVERSSTPFYLENLDRILRDIRLRFEGTYSDPYRSAMSEVRFRVFGHLLSAYVMIQSIDDDSWFSDETWSAALPDHVQDALIEYLFSMKKSRAGRLMRLVERHRSSRAHLNVWRGMDWSEPYRRFSVEEDPSSSVPAANPMAPLNYNINIGWKDEDTDQSFPSVYQSLLEKISEQMETPVEQKEDKSNALEVASLLDSVSSTLGDLSDLIELELASFDEWQDESETAMASLEEMINRNSKALEGLANDVK